MREKGEEAETERERQRRRERRGPQRWHLAPGWLGEVRGITRANQPAQDRHTDCA